MDTMISVKQARVVEWSELGSREAALIQRCASGDEAAFAELVADYPGMLLATAGTLLLVLVAVSSVRRARRKLRYESWHLLHL